MYRNMTCLFVLGLLFSSPCMALEPERRSIIETVSVTSGELRSTPCLQAAWDKQELTPTTILPGGKDLGRVWLTEASHPLIIRFNLPEAARGFQICIEVIGWSESELAKELSLEVNGKSIKKAGPTTGIRQDLCFEEKELSGALKGGANEIRLGPISGKAGIQTVSVGYDLVYELGSGPDSAMLLKLLAPLPGDAIAAGEPLKIAWETTNVPSTAGISIFYREGKGPELLVPGGFCLPVHVQTQDAAPNRDEFLWTPRSGSITLRFRLEDAPLRNLPEYKALLQAAQNAVDNLDTTPLPRDDQEPWVFKSRKDNLRTDLAILSAETGNLSLSLAQVAKLVPGSVPLAANKLLKNALRRGSISDAQQYLPLIDARATSESSFLFKPHLRVDARISIADQQARTGDQAGARATLIQASTIVANEISEVSLRVESLLALAKSYSTLGTSFQEKMY